MVSAGNRPSPADNWAAEKAATPDVVAAAQLDLNLSASWLVGDRESDVICAERANVRPIRLVSHRDQQHAAGDAPLAESLGAAATIIRAHQPAHAD